VIDYRDHYATADPRISRFNFYRCPLDYLRIFSGQQLHTLEVRHVTVPETEIKRVAGCPHFTAYASEDLASLNRLFLLTPPG
jgi:hypothetical protein